MYDETQHEGVEFSPLPFPEDLDTVAPYDSEGGEAEETLPDNVIPFPVPETTDTDEEIVDYTVRYGDHVFQIEEPDAGTIIRLLNFIGTVATRSEKYKSINFQSALRAASEGNYDLLRLELYSFASILSINDLITLSAIVFFGGGRDREKEGFDFFSNLYKSDPHNLKIGPLIKAVAYSLDLSEDIREALGNLALVRFRGPEAKAKTNRQSQG
jgi:hypothetical protein